MKTGRFKKRMQLIFSFLLFPALLDALLYKGYEISKNFETYLIDRYGKEIAGTIYRPELPGSSLGGGNHTAGTSTRKIPIVFIHGLGGRAGEYAPQHKEFQNAGYTLEELYAITWGTPMPRALPTVGHFECRFVLQIRRLVDSVIDFTNASKVDVIGYSMGSPLLRKVILGGPCVDDAEVDLGPPLTSRIQTFLSVGGANYGFHLCPTMHMKMCNSVTGMHCNSTYIREINSRTGYEGSEVFAIYNPHDEIIGGQSVCGIPHYRLNGAENHLYPIPEHFAVLWLSKKLQLELIQRKYSITTASTM